MLNFLRFSSFVLFSLGISLGLVYAVRRLFHHFNRQALAARFEEVFDEAFQIMILFRKHLFTGSDRSNARAFLVNELKRSPIRLPTRFQGFYDLLVLTTISSIEKRQERLASDAVLLSQEVKNEIRRVMMASYDNRIRLESLRWISSAVPLVVAVSTFFPLLIYTYYPMLLRGPFWIFAVIGAVLLMLAATRILREWKP